jgi:UDP-glucuronate 4-epimerase
VQGTLGLLEAVRRHRIERFVYTSSATVYGVGCAAPFQEDGPLGQPASPYAVTKRAAELHCLLYHQLYQLPVVVVRPFSVYGPRLRPDLALSVFANAIEQGRPLPVFGDGSAQRDFTYIDDFLDGLLAAWSSDAAVGQAINLGNHQPAEIRRVIDILSAQLGKPARVDRRAAHPGDMPITCADLTKAQRLIGYRPKVGLEEGIARFVAWFRSPNRITR